jgi:hypothetical protein
MTSAGFETQSRFAKWSARNLAGRPVNAFMSLGSSVDEFVAKIVFSGATAASFS